MYIIEMHYAKRAFAQIIIEKEDSSKTYEQLIQHRVIINHAGDINVENCKWCAIQRRSELLRERRQNYGYNPSVVR